MDAQSICHNRSQLIIPQENHRIFVFLCDWICAAGVRQPHNPARSSHLWLLWVLKTSSTQLRETLSKNNMALRAVTILPFSLACAENLSSCQGLSAEKYILIWQTMELDTLVLFVKLSLVPCCFWGFQSVMQLKGTWKEHWYYQRYGIQWFVTTHVPLWVYSYRIDCFSIKIFWF